MVIGLPVVVDGVNVTWQVAVLPVPESVACPLDGLYVPVPPENVTVPVGVTPPVPVTVAVTVVAEPTMSGFTLNDTATLAVALLTVRGAPLPDAGTLT